MSEKPPSETPDRGLLSPEETERGQIRLEKYTKQAVEAANELPVIAKEIQEKLEELQSTIQKHRESGARLTFSDLESIVAEGVKFPIYKLRGATGHIDYVIKHLVDSMERSKQKAKE